MNIKFIIGLFFLSLTSISQTIFSLRADGTILKNNQPFFPMGFYIDRNPDINVYRTQITNIANAGVFNLLSVPRAGNNAQWTSFLDLCNTKGIYIINQLNYTAPVYDDVDLFKNHPAVYGWSIADDGDNGYFTLAQLQDRNTQTKQRDPNHLTDLSLTGYYQSRRNEVNNYTPIPDVIGYQCYPIAPLADYDVTPQNALTEAYLRTKLYVDAAKIYNKPMILNNQVFSWGADGFNVPVSRYPTALEVRNLAYSGISAGVKGLVSYVYTTGLEAEVEEWNEIKALRTDVTALESALLNGVLTRVNTGDQELVASYWTYNGSCYVVVVNTSYSNAKNASITIPSGYTISPTSLFSRMPNTLSLSGNTLSGVVNPTQVEVYKINNTTLGIGDNEIENKFDVKVYPNPTSQNATLEYNLLENAFVNVSIYNVIGKEASKIINENQSAGNQKLNINTTTLQRGVYFIKISANGNSTTKKIIIQ